MTFNWGCFVFLTEGQVAWHIPGLKNYNNGYGFSGIDSVDFQLIVEANPEIAIHHFNSPIIHFNCPPKFFISIVFNFSWDNCMS